MTYEPIQSTTLTSAASDVTFSSIPGTYTDLVISCSFGATGASQDFTYQFNGDTGTNYSVTILYGNGSSAVSTRETSVNYIKCDSTGVSTTLQAIDIINVMNYANTTTYKTAITRASDASKSTETAVGLWRSTAAITSIKLAMTGNTLLSGSTFTLYGIKAA